MGQNDINFIVSDMANLYIDSILTDNEYLRIDFANGGCKGFKYSLHPTNTLSEEDLIFNRVIINKEFSNFIENTTLEFFREGINQGIRLQFKNSCGCGLSFDSAF